jgi:hypothetical protein
MSQTGAPRTFSPTRKSNKDAHHYESNEAIAGSSKARSTKGELEEFDMFVYSESNLSSKSLGCLFLQNQIANPHLDVIAQTKCKITLDHKVQYEYIARLW